MTIKSMQSRVISLTGRKRILREDVRFSVVGDSVLIERVQGMWSADVDPAWLAAAELHADVRSLQFALRATVPMSEGVLREEWQGASIEMPGGLLSGDYRVKLQVSVVLPASHERAGRILAKSEEMIILEGPDGPAPALGQGGSLLPAVPDAGLDNLCSLEIGHKGPRLLVRSELDRVPWRTFAGSAAFKFGVFPLCLEQVLMHIALSDEESWMRRWLDLDGVKGSEHEIESEDDPATAYRKARVWARDCVQKVAIGRGALQLFLDAWNKERA